MKQTLFLIIGIAMLFAFQSCGAGSAGQKTGQIIRAPYEFITGLGRGIQGKGRLPLREFRQDWSDPEPDPVFWETDEVFFAEVQR